MQQLFMQQVHSRRDAPNHERPAPGNQRSVAENYHNIIIVHLRMAAITRVLVAVGSRLLD